MIPRYAPWLTAGALISTIAPAFALSTGTIVKISGGKYTVDAGKSSGIKNGQELIVLKNGEQIGHLRVEAVRDDESEASLVDSTPDTVIRIGDTVAFQGNETPRVVPKPPPPLPDEPPTPAPSNPSSPSNPAPLPSASDILAPNVAPAPRASKEGSSKGDNVDLQTPGPDEEGVVSSLVDLGFENVMAAPTSSGGLYVEFENRRYRWEVDGLGVAMRSIADDYSASGLLTIVGKLRGVPVYQVQVPLDDFRSYQRGELSDSEFRKILTVTWPGSHGHGGENSSFRRVDATVGRALRVSFVSTFSSPPSNPQALLRLGLESDLFKGLRVRFRELIPLNHATAFPNKPTVDTAEGSYLKKLTPRLYAYAAAGTFQQGVSAVRGEGTYFLSPNLTLVGQVGRTGSDLNKLRTNSYLGTLRAQIPHVDASVYATAGKYIFGDKGETVGFNTQFRERSYEFAYTKTDLERNLSFTLRMPLGSPTKPRPKSLRLREEDQFRFTYFSKTSQTGARFPTESFAENWQLANMPGILPDYVAFLKDSNGDDALRLQEGVRDVPLSKQIGPSLTGSTGLWFTPAAEVVPYGYFVLGANWVDKRYRPSEADFTGKGTMAQYITLGALPRLEITLRITNLNGKLGLQKYFIPSSFNPRGYNIDRMVSMQYQLLTEKGSRPALLVGGQDFLGDLNDISTAVVYKAYYGVASKHFGKIGIHAGLGTDTMKGVLLGVDGALTDRIRLIADHKTGVTTAGVRIEPIKNVRMDLYAPGLKTVGAGLTYTRRM